MEAAQQTKTTPSKKGTRCSYTQAGCTDRAVKIVGECRYCSQKFCGKHRLPESHFCANMVKCREEAAGRNADKLLGERCVSEKV
jgi:small subunit ribosomal protein S27Ae